MWLRYRFGSVLTHDSLCITLCFYLLFKWMRMICMCSIKIELRTNSFLLWLIINIHNKPKITINICGLVPLNSPFWPLFLFLNWIPIRDGQFFCENWAKERIELNLVGIIYWCVGIFHKGHWTLLNHSEPVVQSHFAQLAALY